MPRFLRCACLLAVLAAAVACELCRDRLCEENPLQEARSTYRFGHDEIDLPQAFPFPDREKDEKLTRVLTGFRKGFRLAEDGVGELPTEGLPLRKGVRLFRYQYWGMLALEGGLFTPVTWENIGHFADRIRTAEECRSLLVSLHENMSRDQISASLFHKILRHLESQQERLGFRIVSPKIDEGSVASGCFMKDGYWLWNFLCREGASVVEYKYVVDEDNHVGRLRRVLVEGPENPLRPNEPVFMLKGERRDQFKRFSASLDYLIELIAQDAKEGP